MRGGSFPFLLCSLAALCDGFPIHSLLSAPQNAAPRPQWGFWACPRMVPLHSGGRQGSPGSQDKVLRMCEPLPDTYKALWAEAVGESFRAVASLKEMPMQLPNEGQVLIKVKYAGINGGCETFRARGEAGFARNKEAVGGFGLGAEGSGTVVRVGGGVEGLAPGDDVAFLSVTGGFAEYAVAREGSCIRVPEANGEAAALRISGLTAYAALDTGGAAKGQTVLVTAAAGGAGHFAVQAAKRRGCKVVGTCGSEAKAKMLCGLGCDTIVQYKKRSVREAVERRHPGGVDLVVEHVGGGMLAESLAALRPGGKLVLVGYIAGYPHNPAGAGGDAGGIDCADVFWNGSTVERDGKTIVGLSGMSNGNLDMVFLDHREGRIRAVLDPTPFEGLDSVADAIDFMLSGESMGKVVAKIS